MGRFPAARLKVLHACGSEATLARLKQDAKAPDTNLMPAIIDASGAYVMMGEMCDALRDVRRVWRETPVF